MAMILHITHRHDWQTALDSGDYRAESLTNEGFIHCSTAIQVLRVANSFYRGQSDLVLLVIEPAKLLSPLKYEAPINPQTGQSEIDNPDLFPHIYGVINLEAVVKVVPFPPNADGTFMLSEL